MKWCFKAINLAAGAGAANQPAAKEQSRREVIGSTLGWGQGSGKQG